MTNTATVTSTDLRPETITIYASHGIYFLGMRYLILATTITDTPGAEWITIFSTLRPIKATVTKTVTDTLYKPEHPPCCKAKCRPE